MKKNFVSDRDESVRMFQSSFLEKLSKVHYSVPLFIFIPVIAICLYRSIILNQLHFWSFSGLFLSGLVIWTFTEYNLHRFVFHFEPNSDWGKRIHFMFHGVHHDYPNDSRRLVMPPSVSIPLASLFYFLFYLIMGVKNVDAFFIGFIGGYLFYDITHYALHHANFKNKFWQKLKRHHMQHHYIEPDKGFGVSSDFWDSIYKTNFTGTRKSSKEAL